PSARPPASRHCRRRTRPRPGSPRRAEPCGCRRPPRGRQAREAQRGASPHRARPRAFPTRSRPSLLRRARDAASARPSHRAWPRRSDDPALPSRRASSWRCRSARVAAIPRRRCRRVARWRRTRAARDDDGGMPLRLTVWDGAGVIGGNKVLLETDDRALFLDFGTAFATMDQYFADFLGSRANRGLLDLVELDILPPLDGVYRRDLYPPDGSVEDRMGRKPDHRRIEVQAILASHAHVDHNGAIASVREDVPIHCSPMTAVIGKAMQDCGGQYPGDIAYIRSKSDDHGLLRTNTTTPARQRPLAFQSNAWSAEAAEFWARRDTKPGLEGAAPRLGAVDVAGLPYREFAVDHSILGATAFAIETTGGVVAYTGDIRMHGRTGEMTRRFAQALADRPPRVLITEGTHLGDETALRAEGNLPLGSEQQVRDRALEVLRAARGFVAADFQPRHIERLMTFRDVARET